MGFNFAKAKLMVRRVVHATLGVTAFYKDNTLSAPIEIRVRAHNRLDRMADLNNEYSEVLEGINRIIFDRQSARAANIKRGGQIWVCESLAEIPEAQSYTLDSMEPYDGPVEEIWIAADA